MFMGHLSASAGERWVPALPQILPGLKIAAGLAVIGAVVGSWSVGS